MKTISIIQRLILHWIQQFSSYAHIQSSVWHQNQKKEVEEHYEYPEYSEILARDCFDKYCTIPARLE